MALTLATVETAIENLIAGGQSFTIDGQTYTQASLAGLMAMRKELRKEAGSTGHAFGYRVRPLQPPEH
jgi:hypothetical protein